MKKTYAERNSVNPYEAKESTNAEWKEGTAERRSRKTVFFKRVDARAKKGGTLEDEKET